MSRRLDTTRTAPDILDCIANLSSDEVFTPPRLVNQMLDLLPKEVWKNPDLKWLDPGTKTGVFLREIAKRLMDHLAEAIPDEDARREHIYKNMLYGLPITELTSMLARRSVYYSKNADSEKYAVVRMGSAAGNIPLVETKHSFKSGSCTQCGAPESLERGEARENYAYPFIHPDQLPKELKDMKFDVIVGNPPYQIGDGGETSASPIYQKFVETAIDMAPRHVLMIIPSRWFTGGKGLDSFRARMLADKRISHLVDHVDATECFPGVDIQGGVNYFLWDEKHRGECSVTTMEKGKAPSQMNRHLDEHDVFIRSNESMSILSQVASLAEPTVEEMVSSQTPFGIHTNFKDFIDQPAEGLVRLHMRDGASGWVERAKITRHQEWIDKHKVFLPVAYGERGLGPYFVLGKPFTGDSPSACTQTYSVAGVFDSETEASNYQTYLNTRFVRFLVSLRKQTQHIRPSCFRFVPKLDMTIAWTDEMLFQRYGLSEDDILFIKSQVKERA